MRLYLNVLPLNFQNCFSETITIKTAFAYKNVDGVLENENNLNFQDT